MPRTADEITRTVERTPAQRPLGAVIRVLNVPATPSELRLVEGTCRIGSGPGVDLLVTEPTVSRAHAEVALAPEGVRVTDLASRNGSSYLGKPFEQATVAFGARFRVGNAELEVGVDRATLDAPSSVDLTSYGDLIGVSPSMRRLFGQLLRLEPSLVTVLIEGEPGTGKALAARALHEHSSVSMGPFVPVTCSELDKVKLFGHRKGAFAGAVSGQAGAFEAANGGTLFLEGVVDLPLELQPLLLRALETRSVLRVGESAERAVNVRVVAATHHDLSSEVDAGRFNRDLYFRLAVVKLAIPPLRERPDAIDAIARHMARGLGLDDLPATLLDDLRRRPFPGNVRELRNVLESHAVLGPAPDSSVPWGSSDLADALRRAVNVEAPFAPQKDALVRLLQSVFVEALLAHTGGNQADAARLSGIERSYLSKVAERQRK